MVGTKTECRVCVVGMGDMGSALAEVLLNKGHRVTVWNRTASKCDPLAALGASVAPSVARGINAADVTVVCVIDHQASADTLQSDQVAQALRGKLLVQLTTVTAEQSRALGQWAGDNGIDYLDGAILGYPQHMRSQNCAIVYSGAKAAFDANAAVFAAMGSGPRFLGEAVGGAPNFDKAMLSCHYGSILGFFHGAAICRASDFPVEIYTDLALGAVGEVTRSMQKLHGGMIANRSYDVEAAPMELEAAAIAQIVTVSESLGVDPALPKMIARYIERAIAEGYGQKELAAVSELLADGNA